MKHIISLSLLIILNTLIFAGSGDTTTVLVHQELDIHWQGSSYKGKYDEIANFPASSENFQEIKMSFSIGCNNAGVCSHWDYDINLYVGDYSGIFDSTIASYDTLNYQALELDTVSLNPLVLDTISTNPLELDTIQNYIFEADTNWNVFEVIIWHEIGRMITPYATYMDNGSNGWDNTWWHTYTYDVTDFRPFLTGQTPVRVDYHGWQDGWRVSTKFDFIEGKPTRDVVKVEDVYSGGSYTSFAQFDAENTPTKTISLGSEVEEAKLRVFVTGHGQYGEFTPIKYKVKSGNTLIKEENIWRDDCGMVAISPQGGTWVFNRANWCPGDKVYVQEFDFSEFIEGTGNNKTLNINIDFDSFTPNPIDAAYYSLSAQLVTYKKYRRDFDVALEEIIAPTDNENFVRMNSICTAPTVRIKNNGKQDLTSCEIKYWVSSTNYRYYVWNGNLKYGESEDVSLETMDWTGVDANNPVFYAEANWPNGVIDQFPYNNLISEKFTFPDMLSTGNIKIRFRANNHPNENRYTLKRYEGSIVSEKTSFTANAYNEDVVDLEDGCYVFEFYDKDEDLGLGTGGDGIKWWFNTQNGYETSGSLRFRNATTNAIIKNFNGDFGTKIYYAFTVGKTLDQLPALTKHIEPEHSEVTSVFINGEEFFLYEGIYYGENSINGINDLDEYLEDVKIFPNPSKNDVSFIVNTKIKKPIFVTINNIIGEEISSFEMKANKIKNISTKEFSNGVYIVNFKIENKSSSRKLVIQK